MQPDRPVHHRLEIPLSWGLTPQESRVAGLVLRGLTNRQVSAALSIGENTVQTHLGHIYTKLDVHSRSQLSARYFRDRFGSGLLDDSVTG